MNRSDGSFVKDGEPVRIEEVRNSFEEPRSWPLPIWIDGSSIDA
jgi:hypothetical protein